MNTSKIDKIFKKSENYSCIYEITKYSVYLLCGYFISFLLKYATCGQTDKIRWISLFLILFLLLSVFPLWFLSMKINESKLSCTQKFREFLCEKIISRNITAETQGEAEVRLNFDCETIADYYSSTFPKDFSGIIIMLTSAFLLCINDLKTGILFFFLNFIQLLPIITYEKWSRKIYNQVHGDEEAYMNLMLEGYNGIRTIKAYTAEDFFIKRYRAANEQVIKSGKTAEKTGTVENIIFAAIDSILKYGSYVIIGLFILNGSLKAEKAPILIILSGYLFSSISNVFSWYLDKFQFEEAVKNLGISENIKKEVPEKALISVQNAVKIRKDKKVLDNVNLDIYKGDRIWLKGINGSGKSTLLKLITQIEKPDSGKILVSDCSMSFSLQEDPAIDISGDNLRDALIQNGGMSENDFNRHANNFNIIDLLHKPISQLSGGERKKFYLSVALSRQSEILILDEPTNHLDNQSVNYLCEELLNYDGTLILCAHSELQNLNFNRIILTEGGKCREICC